MLEQRETFAAVGAGIQLGPNGVRVLQRLGVADALRPLVGVPEAVRVHDGKTARVLADLPLGDWIAARHGAPYWVAHRGDLAATLLAAASADPRIELRPGFAFASLVETGDGVEATSTGGETMAGAALIGADGLWSQVRQVDLPGRGAAVRRRHGDARRSPRCRGGRGADIGGRVVADPRRPCRALPGAGRRARSPWW